MSDSIHELGDDSRQMQRANARNHINESYEALTSAAQGFIATYVGVMQGLDLTETSESAAAFEAIVLSLNRAYDVIDAELDADMQREQKGEV